MSRSLSRKAKERKRCNESLVTVWKHVLWFITRECIFKERKKLEKGKLIKVKVRQVRIYLWELINGYLHVYPHYCPISLSPFPYLPLPSFPSPCIYCFSPFSQPSHPSILFNPSLFFTLTSSLTFFLPLPFPHTSPHSHPPTPLPLHLFHHLHHHSHVTPFDHSRNCE